MDGQRNTEQKEKDQSNDRKHHYQLGELDLRILGPQRRQMDRSRMAHPRHTHRYRNTRHDRQNL